MGVWAPIAELHDPGILKLRLWQHGLGEYAARLFEMFPDPHDCAIAVVHLTVDAALFGRDKALERWFAGDDKTVKQQFLRFIIMETTRGAVRSMDLRHWTLTNLEQRLLQIKARQSAQAQKQRGAGSPGALVNWVLSAGGRGHTTNTRRMKLHAE